jgi:mannose-6-phosphate isomerase
MGAHPDSPSRVGGVPLDAVLAAAPDRLGPAVTERFGARLPFILKLLAAAEPLSLQAHPDAGTAARRYAEERAAGAPVYSYTDPYAKPELLVAVEPMDALCGFRDPGASAAALDRLGVAALDPVVAGLRGQASVGARLRAAVETLLRWPAPDRGRVVADVAASGACPPHVAALAARHPGDMGVIVAMLLHHVALCAGDAIWMPAGNMHAYLRGTGVELLGASDNVLRGGFTPKRVDVEELLLVLDYAVLAEPLMKPVILQPGLVTWPTPVAEFALTRADLHADHPVELPAGGPRVVFCLTGSVTADDGAGAITLSGGRSAFGSAGRPVTLSGDGVTFVATTG